MALLSGCDYCPDGVPGVGKDTILNFFQFYSNSEILDRIKSWKMSDSMQAALEKKVEDHSICIDCGHYGRLKVHSKNGCTHCNQTKGCDANLWRQKRLAIKSELQIKKKVHQIDNFPNQEIINEFLNKPISLSELNHQWEQPNLSKFMVELLQWNEIYSFQKFLPLMTRWQLLHGADKNASFVSILTPEYIKKKRSPKGIASYEVVWTDEKKYVAALIPDDQWQEYLKQTPNAAEELWITIEPAELVEKSYPALVTSFMDLNSNKKMTRKRVPCNSDSAALNSDEKNMKKTLKSKTKTKKGAKISNDQLIDKFFPKTKSSRLLSKKLNVKTADLNNIQNISLDIIDESGYDDPNLSDIIEGITTRTPDFMEFRGRHLRYGVYQPTNDFNNSKSESIKSNNDMSYDSHETEQTKCTLNNLSYDEFDFMVFRNNSRKEHQENISTPDGKSKCSINSKKYFNKFKRCSDPNVSSFFGNVMYNELGEDLFEKSIDFKNMPDEYNHLLNE